MRPDGTCTLSSSGGLEGICMYGRVGGVFPSWEGAGAQMEDLPFEARPISQTLEVGDAIPLAIAPTN